MNAVIGSVDVTEDSVLRGGHHIVTALPLKDAITSVKPGMLLKIDTGKYAPCTGADTEDPVAVLLEVPALPTSAAVELAAIHGEVRREKLVFSDGTTAITDAYVELLRKNGIYAL
jgi:hypothetical protein